ncbi:protein kinase [Cronbergia sp. UHCC 0137]|uniref:protein kinase domain-containing protein n=1 Tax=Cronbergia sp. UHCC 0137 TaxID=3110239 RepID=UPI002B206CC1|nr:protein kinase [Cronbergia sp. UHCC 0137]MEA5617480.1 protein kinase [Cronbergia sp. UHCC 0137]
MTIGMKIDGRYEITKNFGGGGFGTTFLAEDTKRPGNPKCIIKQFTPPSTDPETLAKLKDLFYQEAVMLETLGEHKQIPKLLAKIEENKEDYIVQEYIEGHDLSDELLLGQKKSESEVIQLLIEILEVLEFVHQHKVIHRDIKPTNIRRRTSDNKIVLIDFGAVKQVSTQVVNGQLQFTLIIRTPGYAPSEQKDGNPQFSSDVYAVGIIAIEALTGLSPLNLKKDVNTEIIWRKDANVSPKLAAVLDKMVRHNYRHRYSTAKEALQAVRNLSPKPIDWKLLLGLGMGAFTILILLLIPKKDEVNKFNIYKNSNYNITIEYPKTWERQDLQNPITDEVVTFISPKQSDGDRFQEKVTIRVDSFSGGLNDLEQSSIQEIKNTSPGAKIIDNNTTTLANKEARQLIFTGKSGKDSFKNLQIMTLKGDQAYTITYTAKVDDYDEFVETAKTIIKSLEIKEN